MRPDRAHSHGHDYGHRATNLRPVDQLRIGDRERAEALRMLGEHFAVGRLDREEYDERADAALRARTAAEVAPLFVDLPGPAPGPPEPVVRDLPTAVGASRTAAPRRRPHRRAGVPFLPMLLLLIGFAALLGAGWLVPVGLALWFLLPRRGRGRPPGAGMRPVFHASGSRRPSRGSWA